MVTSLSFAEYRRGRLFPVHRGLECGISGVQMDECFIMGCIAKESSRNLQITTDEHLANLTSCCARQINTFSVPNNALVQLKNASASVELENRSTINLVSRKNEANSVKCFIS